ncbi:MAG: hypothetical protein J3K34DRAFT_398786 [Monoraphidium minutum]|nr:MAG: hypothetical protein J3K34DRAFT_398786 [Monoraphidium minutum]
MILLPALSAGLGRLPCGLSRRPSLLVRAQTVKGALWSLRKAINQRRNRDTPGALTSFDLEDLKESSSNRMTLGSISVEGGSTKRKAGGRSEEEEEADYGRESILDIARSRTGWLVAFCVGLLLAALVVEQFEDVLEQHVELSFFVPLIMGHGGNTGSQAVTTVIRALALKQITNRDIPRTVLKEAGAGAMMGAILGLAILGFSMIWSGISTQVGATVAIALPLVSAWANGLGAFFTLLADRLRFDPAVTSVPLVTTIVDSTGLVLYFFVAKWLLGIEH